MQEGLSTVIEGFIDQVGRSFFLRGFLPALVIVILNQYILFGPVLSEAAALNFFPGITQPLLDLFTGEVLTTLVLAFIGALLLLPLNTTIVRHFEGLPIYMRVLLGPWYAGKLQKHKRHYAAVEDTRRKRRAMLDRAELDEDDYDADLDFELMNQLDQLHREREQVDVIPTLPVERRRVLPTHYGNAWATMEEYSLARYGLDNMVFWPYVRAVMVDKNPATLAQIDNQKLMMDISLHLAFLIGIGAIESLLVGLFRLDLAAVLLAVVLGLLYAALYRASVDYTRSMGALVAQSVDMYRLYVLDSLGIKRPDDLDEEYTTWRLLAAFIRRGEPFYFDQLERVDELDEDEEDEAAAS
ncbi:MAG: hypothetical protein GYB68_09495 [Chloroflexi bacterium]|nr:hypothetical protein [Chloroflexota bacterium]